MNYKIITCECGNTYSKDIWEGKCRVCGKEYIVELNEWDKNYDKEKYNEKYKEYCKSKYFDSGRK